MEVVRSGGYRLFFDDAARIGQALSAFGLVAERLVCAVRAIRAFADGVAHLVFADGITNANEHAAPLDSQASAIATDYQ